jgi:hypothetical protein
MFFIGSYSDNKKQTNMYFLEKCVLAYFVVSKNYDCFLTYDIINILFQ